MCPGLDLGEGGKEGAKGREAVVWVFLEYLVESSLAQKQLGSHFPFLGCKLHSYLKLPYFHLTPSQIKKINKIKSKNDYFLGVPNFI